MSDLVETDTREKIGLISVVLGDHLTIEPSTSKRSLRLKDACVTAQDQSNQPLSGVKVEAFVHGKGALVIPSSVVTDADGKAKFKFKFGFITKDGEITFIVDDIKSSIMQEN